MSYKLVLYTTNQSSKPLILKLKDGIRYCTLADLQRDMDLHSLGYPTRCITSFGIRLFKKWFDGLEYPLCFNYCIYPNRAKNGKKKVKSL